MSTRHARLSGMNPTLPTRSRRPGLPRPVRSHHKYAMAYPAVTAVTIPGQSGGVWRTSPLPAERVALCNWGVNGTCRFLRAGGDMGNPNARTAVG